MEYLSDKLQAQDLDNRAWGGARTDEGHYLGFDGSGFNWQIDRFELQSKPEETLFTVWIGVRELARQVVDACGTPSSCALSH